MKENFNIYFVRGAPPPGSLPFWLESPYPTGYRVSLVSVSESNSQKSVSPNFPRILSTESAISQQNKNSKIVFS